MLRRIFGPMRDEVMGKLRKLHNKKFNDLCSSPNIFRVIKSRGMSWAGYVSLMGERRDACKVLVVKPEERDYHLKYLGINMEDNIKIDV
jgi:hypothetical protein